MSSFHQIKQSTVMQITKFTKESTTKERTRHRLHHCCNNAWPYKNAQSDKAVFKFPISCRFVSQKKPLKRKLSRTNQNTFTRKKKGNSSSVYDKKFTAMNDILLSGAEMGWLWVNMNGITIKNLVTIPLSVKSEPIIVKTWKLLKKALLLHIAC